MTEPTLRTVDITLRISYDPRNSSDPEYFDWASLLDLAPNENVEVLESEEISVSYDSGI